MDVLVLSLDRNPRQSRQVDDGQIRTILRMYVQNYGLIDDILLCAADLISHQIDVLLHLRKVREFFVGKFFKFCIWFLDIVAIAHSDFQWPSGHHSLNYSQLTDPLGRKSIPTTCSTSELFPELWLPTATILGSRT